MAYLRILFEAFRFIQRYRDRQAALRAEDARERALEREHQRLLIEGVFTRLVDLAKANQEGILKLAEAQAAQAEGFTTWIKGFQLPAGDSGPVPSQTVREEDEWMAEHRRLREAGDPSAFPVDLPPEFQLALTLQKAELAAGGFDREGSDF